MTCGEERLNVRNTWCFNLFLYFYRGTTVSTCELGKDIN